MRKKVSRYHCPVFPSRESSSVAIPKLTSRVLGKLIARRKERRKQEKTHFYSRTKNIVSEKSFQKTISLPPPPPIPFSYIATLRYFFPVSVKYYASERATRSISRATAEYARCIMPPILLIFAGTCLRFLSHGALGIGFRARHSHL